MPGYLAREARWRLHSSGMTSEACFGSDHASAVLLAAFPSDRTPVVAATACLVPFILDPAAALGRPPLWRMKVQCVSVVAAFLLGVSPAAYTRQPSSESVLAGLRPPACSSVRSWLLCLRSGPLSALALLPAPTPVLQMPAPVRRGVVADARLGLALFPIYVYTIFLTILTRAWYDAACFTNTSHKRNVCGIAPLNADKTKAPTSGCGRQLSTQPATRLVRPFHVYAIPTTPTACSADTAVLTWHGCHTAASDR